MSKEKQAKTAHKVSAANKARRVAKVLEGILLSFHTARLTTLPVTQSALKESGAQSAREGKQDLKDPSDRLEKLVSRDKMGPWDQVDPKDQLAKLAIRAIKGHKVLKVREGPQASPEQEDPRAREAKKAMTPKLSKSAALGPRVLKAPKERRGQ